MRLPQPGKRDPICSCSRSWLTETDARLPAEEKFIFRIRQKGRLRGCVFVDVRKLLQFISKAKDSDEYGSGGTGPSEILEHHPETGQSKGQAE